MKDHDIIEGMYSEIQSQIDVYKSLIMHMEDKIKLLEGEKETVAEDFYASEDF